ncbi:MAG: hypothetical protein GX823_01565, partial [Clostridiales bacterium]|nr:hypothetical protein [Clostridiales bacterium]
MYATKMRRMLASLLAVVALFSMSAATASADGGELYEVSVYVPVGTDVSFYPTTGLDAGGVDQFSPGDEITADITPEADYNVHKMQLRGGTYSFRGTDADDGYDVGGSVFDVPAKLYGGGVSPVDNCEIYLRRAKIGIYNAGATAGDFTVSLRSEVGVSTLGGAGVHTGGEPVYHALLYVNGNANLYSYAITPTGEYAQSTGVAEYSDSNQAYTAGTTARIILATLPAAKYVTLNAPKGAKAALYEQINNYNTQELAPDSIDGSKSDGTTDYVYRLGSGNYTYRVSAAGYVTQAGYLSSPKSGQVITVEFDPALNPKAQLQSQTHDGEASALLNINERNKLSLQVGGKFKVRAYRAAWQIVNSVSSNIMIEPDFTYSVISGADVIKIEQEDGGNAGGNWAWITALKAGVAIVEVTYDAIVIDGSKLYGANDALRTGVFVVHVGSGGADIGGIDWDAEYDTHYFLGETGGLTINPDGSEVSVRVAPVAGGGMSG